MPDPPRPPRSARSGRRTGARQCLAFAGSGRAAPLGRRSVPPPNGRHRRSRGRHSSCGLASGLHRRERWARRWTHQRHDRERSADDEVQPGGRAGGARQPRADAAGFEDRDVCLSGRRGRVQQLARRAEGVAQLGGAVRPVAPHGRGDRRGAGCRAVPAGAGDQQLQGLRDEPGQALRAGRPRGLRDRRHDLLSRARGQVRAGRPGADGELGRVQRHARHARREDHPRPALAVAARRQPGRARALPLPDPGARRAGDLREAERRADPGHQVLPCRRDQRRRAQGAGAAARHGRGAGPRDLGALRREGRDPSGDPAGGEGGGVGPAPGRLARLFDEHARVRAGSRRRCRRSTRAPSSRGIASGSARTATRRPGRSAAASSRTTSATTTPRPSRSATAST